MYLSFEGANKGGLRVLRQIKSLWMPCHKLQYLNIFQLMCLQFDLIFSTKGHFKEEEIYFNHKKGTFYQIGALLMYE